MKRSTFLPYCRPAIDADDVASVRSTLENFWLTTGPNVAKFEARFAEAAGVEHAVALSSCTAGLHLGMLAFGVGRGDEVIMPSLTFVAGAESARQIGATPVFCDVEEDTLSVSVRTIEQAVTSRTKLIIPMHYAGNPLHVRDIVEFARARRIPVLEDAAHAVGMRDEGRWAGALSGAAAYSFYATKNLATAEGGMFLTNDDDIAQRVRILSLHGMDRDAWKRYTEKGTWRYDVTAVGYKYNMPDLCAALGLSQLAKLERLQARRTAIARRYVEAFREIPGVDVPALAARPGDRHSWCMFPIVLDERQSGIGRDDFIDAMRDANVGTSVHYIPTHLFSAFRDCPAGRLPVTERIWQRLVSLPLFPSMSDDDVESVIDAVSRICKRQMQAAG